MELLLLLQQQQQQRYRGGRESKSETERESHRRETQRWIQIEVDNTVVDQSIRAGLPQAG
jgi:hypothetical protein